ncbi:hypothetical protein M408DRAFT_26477 [Serendipita vermifera MAFF 305830]|uniref:DNA repair protein rad9 n=1 Tax=Serendipita vermifera MAFF 305830 TaxID=933852 RepID=A0A0C2X716_SERVB|nr:hypothetical protein M408DRAFT_26477 [Serendipita vermifera MAFF 305830]
MQATVGLVSLKPFSRALACLCRYGDEVTIHPTGEWLSLSVQGVGNTSFCRFKFLRTFFDRGYRVGTQTASAEQDPVDDATNLEEEDDVQEVEQVYGIVAGKLVLAVLRGPAAEKNAEKCHLLFLEGVEPGQQTSEGESIETRLVLKLQYKHGVLKTHTFPLSSGARPQAPRLPSGRPISSVRIGGRTLKELIEHFPRPERGAGGSRADPLLIWQFHDDKASIKTEDRWNTTRGEWSGTAGKGGRRGKQHLGEDNEDDGAPIYSTVNSSLTLQDSEFEAYEIYYGPVTLGIHLKELNATLAVAEALGSDIVLRFTASGKPIFFSLESSMGTYSAFCALSTKAVKEARDDGKQPTWETNGAEERHENNTVQRKRQREADGEGTWKASKRPAPGHPAGGLRTPDTSAASTSTFSRPRSGSQTRDEMDLERSSVSDGTPSFAGVMTSTVPRSTGGRRRREESEEEEPLFLPEASQSVDSHTEPPASQVLRDAGLGDFERMSQVELRAMLGDDDEDMNASYGDGGGGGDDVDMNDGGWEDTEGETEKGYYAPTQRSKADDFRPLFDD